MISLKVLSTAAGIALLAAMATPTASFAQHPGRGAGGGVHVGGGGGPHIGGGGGPRFGRGGGGGVAIGRGGGGGNWAGGYRRGGGGGGFLPGAVAGALIGGAIATAPYGYYGGPAYYPPGYYDDQYYDQGPVVVAPVAPDGDDAVAYCMQTYRSYDPRSGTYLGYDGYRHPCP
jgi:hypothetical protein